MKNNIFVVLFLVLSFSLPLAVQGQVGPGPNPFSTSASEGASGLGARGLNAGGSLAAGGCPTSVRSLTNLVDYVLCFLQSLMPLLFTLALIYFLWGAVQFIQSEDKGRDEARNKMLYGIIGLFVMVSVWGLVAVLTGTFNLSNNIPTVPAFVR